MAVDRHSVSNKHYLGLWHKSANEQGSKVFLALGIDAGGDLQLFLIDDIPLKDIPKILIEAAKWIEQGQQQQGKIILPPG